MKKILMLIFSLLLLFPSLSMAATNPVQFACRDANTSYYVHLDTVEHSVFSKWFTFNTSSYNNDNSCVIARINYCASPKDERYKILWMEARDPRGATISRIDGNGEEFPVKPGTVMDKIVTCLLNNYVSYSKENR